MGRRVVMSFSRTKHFDLETFPFRAGSGRLPVTAYHTSAKVLLIFPLAVFSI